MCKNLRGGGYLRPLPSPHPLQAKITTTSHTNLRNSQPPLSQQIPSHLFTQFNNFSSRPNPNTRLYSPNPIFSKPSHHITSQYAQLQSTTKTTPDTIALPTTVLYIRLVASHRQRPAGRPAALSFRPPTNPNNKPAEHFSKSHRPNKYTNARLRQQRTPTVRHP
jgi:hypothetical protein